MGCGGRTKVSQRRNQHSRGGPGEDWWHLAQLALSQVHSSLTQVPSFSEPQDPRLLEDK
jgi:hypothetical protein